MYHFNLPRVARVAQCGARAHRDRLSVTIVQNSLRRLKLCCFIHISCIVFMIIAKNIVELFPGISCP